MIMMDVMRLYHNFYLSETVRDSVKLMRPDL